MGNGIDFKKIALENRVMLDAALAGETVLREELASLREVNRLFAIAHEDSRNHVIKIERRLTVAEQRAGELEAAAQEMLRVAGIANQGSGAYTRAIINLNAALKPANNYAPIDDQWEK